MRARISTSRELCVCPTNPNVTGVARAVTVTTVTSTGGRWGGAFASSLQQPAANANSEHAETIVARVDIGKLMRTYLPIPSAAFGTEQEPHDRPLPVSV